ncbi:MAG: putative spermidine/putrescine transport system permease protein [Chloroflexota bacterium]|jgi:putative spermidine/putrescine transport system permease protein|nr:putative spermidine/putrescine transport system permease protein [Chloroflexota bacterium]
MILPRGLRIALRIASGLTIAFIYLPIAIIVLYSFNAARVATWPISGLTLDWYGRALGNAGIRTALVTSLQAGVGATIVALVLGSLIAFAVQRHAFFGRQTLSFVVVLPLALPGIVTGLALNSAFRALGLDFGLLTIVVGHATFCVVVVFNNVVARLRRTARTPEEASLDLGADTFTTFRRITFPAIRSALLAGALLAFALSFDEIIVTNFTSGAGTQTLPLWIFTNYQRPNNLPLVNVAAVIVLVLSIVPVYIASRLTSGTESTGRS